MATNRDIFRKANTDTGVEDIYAIEGGSARHLNPTEFQDSFASPTNSQGVKNSPVNDLGLRDDLYNQYFPQSNTGADNAPNFPIANPVDTITDNGEDGIISNTDNIRNELGEFADEFENQEQTTDLPEGNTYDTQYDFLEQWKNTEVARLEAEYGAKKEAKERTQKGEVGLKTSYLAGVGALSQTSVGISNLKSQQLTHIAQISALDMEKTQLINELKMAISKERYQVSKDKKAEINKINDDISDKQKDLFTMKRDELDLQRQADQDEQEMEEYRRTRAIEDIEISAKSGGELEPEQIQLLAQDMNMTIPQFNAYYASYQASKEASDYEMGLKLAKLEKDVATVDWETEKIDKGAYSYTYVYDPTDREGTYKEIGKAPRWKYDGGGDGENRSEEEGTLKEAIISGLENDDAYGEDGKVAWETYLSMKQDWVNNGGVAGEFDINFPVNQYMDENNAKEYLIILGKN